MMIVRMDKMSATSSREHVQRLYEKNIDLENKRRRSAQAQVPSDLNAWQQMRENYEAIILEDHGFAELQNVEYALWQLHYRRIEELRAHFSAVIASNVANASQGAKVPARPDRITKIRLQFKTFLSEATGFYHDLILKIRAKYGLPLGYFSEDSDSRVALERDGKKSTDLKKGLISCHRCLIYLGDLARYKGLYGEGDSKTREYGAASSYYLQAASLWPSSGNPHHQLAIVASYSGDEFLAVYRYFRSLAVDNPFTTARDNLIVAFEKNRQSYSQLLGDAKASLMKDSSARGRGKGETKLVSKDKNLEANGIKEKTSDAHEMLKSFCIRFVRLNGILFTRTSMETFAEVLALVCDGFTELLSSGPEEKLNFGADVVENGLFIVRLISIIVFTIHNVKREAEGQSYAEIVQRAVLLQNALTAAFEFMGKALEHCNQLHDPSSSYLLSAIMVFVEWLACSPDIASGRDADEKQATARLFFWNHCLSFFNKILSLGPIYLDDNEDETFFQNMSHYEEGETGNRLALWEDIELRGFLPLLPAQSILDFSRKHSFGSHGSKEKTARIKRILAAGKSVVNNVKIDQKTVQFDLKMKKFIVGTETQVPVDHALTPDSSPTKSDEIMQDMQPRKMMNSRVLQSSPQLYEDGEDDDEVIVFKPAISEKRNDMLSPKRAANEGLKLGQNASTGDLQFYGNSVTASLDNFQQRTNFDGSPEISACAGTFMPQYQQPVQRYQQPVQPQHSKWLLEDATSLANSLKVVGFMENGHVLEHYIQQDNTAIHPAAQPVTMQQSVNGTASDIFYSRTMAAEVIPSKIDAVASSAIVESLAMMPSGLRKSPVSRPVRHLGPPPGFSHIPKQGNDPVPGSDMMGMNQLLDDYSWLDGYQLPSSIKGSGLNVDTNFTSHMAPQYVTNSNGMPEVASFPFPGKQIPPAQLQAEKQKGWQNYALEHLRLEQEQHLQQQVINGNQQFSSIPEQYHGQSMWSGRYVV